MGVARIPMCVCVGPPPSSITVTRPWLCAAAAALASTSGTSTAGTLLFSPSTTRLVVVAADLQTPPSGKEYRCWVEVDGKRSNVGRMFFADELAFWVGDTPEVSDLPDGTTFGVSLADVGGSSLDGQPVITGEL